MTLPRVDIGPIDAAYARVVIESREMPQRLDDALARIDDGHVAVDAFYASERGKGTPLALAIGENELVLADELLARGSDPNARCIDEAIGLATAPIVNYARSVEALERLVKAGARLDAASIDGETFVQHCIRTSRVTSHPLWLALATRAIALGADIAQTNDAGQDAATFAASMGARVAKTFSLLLGTAAPPAKTKATPKPRAPRKRA